MDTNVGNKSGNSGNNGSSGNSGGNGSDSAGKRQQNQAHQPHQANHAAQAKSPAAEERDKLMDNMKTIIADAEAWLKDGIEQEGEDIVAIRKNFETSLQTTKTDLLKIQDDMLAKTRLAAQATDTYVKTNPWKAVSVGATIGLLVGLLISRN